MAAASSSQVWAILSRHARDEIQPLRLQELCRDNDRVSSLVEVHNVSDKPKSYAESSSSVKGPEQDHSNRILLVDLSRQRMTLDTLNHLLRFSTARNLNGFIRMLAWGQNDPNDPIVPMRIRKQKQQERNALSDANKKKTRFTEEAVSAAPFSETSQLRINTFPKNLRHGTYPAPSTQQTETVAGTRTTPISNLSDGTSPSMHLALRAPKNCGLEMLTADGSDALLGIHNEWDRIKRFSESVRQGKLRGVSGAVIRDVVVVGRGVPIMALRFLYEALLHDNTASLASKTDGGISYAADSRTGLLRSASTGGGKRRLKFLSSVDPSAAISAVSDLDPGSTIIVSIDLRGDDETALATKIIKNWLLQGLRSNKSPVLTVNKHMILVTGSERLAKAYKKENVFLIPEHSRCEAFTTFTASALLPLSIIFGWNVVNEVLAGAHDIDIHFVETNPRHNLPVLLALSDFWNEGFLDSFGRIVSPFTGAFASFPSYVAALEAQTCGRMADRGAKTPAITAVNRTLCSGMVIDGGIHGSHDRALYQSGRIIASELVMEMDAQASTTVSEMFGPAGLEEVLANQDSLMCSFFAHADALAFGTDGNPTGTAMSPRTPTERQLGVGRGAEPEVSEGNRPSALLLCGKLDAFACGQVLALSEHRAVVKAHLWDLDPFADAIGASLREKRTESLREELHMMYDRISITGNADDDERLKGKNANLSTSTILGHYANHRDESIYVVKGQK